jgi:putative transposase
MEQWKNSEVSHLAGIRYRLNLTAAQELLLVRTFGCIRWVVNRMIDERQRRWRDERKGTSYKEMSALLTQWKAQPEFAWLNEVSCVPLQQALRHLDKAYGRFFKWCRMREGRKVGYPNFLRKHDHQSAEFTTSAFGWDGRTLTMAKSKEPLDLIWTQVFWGDPSTMTISREADGTYWVSLLTEVEPAAAEGGRDVVGIDLGLTHYVTDDQGNKVDAPKPLRKAQKRLVREQRRHARKKKGSNNREKARGKVARIHAHVRRARLDFLHKLSTQLIAENQVICIETLRVAGMMRNRRLARSISDAAWGEFVRQLEYKAEWYGRTVVRISPWEPSSKRCSAPGCGHVLKDLDLKVRAWTCPSCGMAHDRDVNAAINIRVAGLAILAERSNACGADVRRETRKGDAQSAKSGAEWLRRKQEDPLGIRGGWKLAA